MKTKMIKSVIVMEKTLRIAVSAAFVSTFLLATSASGQLVDGNFDRLPVGTAPDDDMPAGAWHFPNVDDSGEFGDLERFSIVSTDSFDPGAKGNSLFLNSTDTNDDTGISHLSNLFLSTVTTDLILRFETYVPIGGGDGTFYLSGDHGGGGLHNEFDRGPQFSFFSNGDIVVADPDGNPVVVGTFDFDQWVQIELHISLEDDNYEIYSGPRDGVLSLLASELGFRSGQLEFFDRVSFAYFGSAPFLGSAHQYFDNLELIVLGDVNQDGMLNLLDVEPFVDVLASGDYQIEADVNQDGFVNLLDVSRFVELLSS